MLFKNLISLLQKSMYSKSLDQMHKMVSERIGRIEGIQSSESFIDFFNGQEIQLKNILVPSSPIYLITGSDLEKNKSDKRNLKFFVNKIVSL